jgi:tetratricopeptide (TPR) repeat protein
MTSTNPTPQSREIRVFLSSTFKDMDAERNHLVKQVFPKVRAACLARQVGFTEIDLRWGVTEEESQNGATVEICLKEIDRCRDFPPFFIGFLGERYGWIPRHDDLATYWQKHADSPYAKPIQQAVKRGISVTELEMELAVLGEGAADKLHGHALFLLRDRPLTDTLYRQDTGKAPDPTDPRYYDPAGNRLQALKNRIRATPFLGIEGYQSVEQFGQAIEDYLLAQLDRHFPASAVPSELERQQAAHANFRYHRLQNFLPRTDVRQQLLKAIARRIDKPYLGPIILAGPSGQGKSALMADLARHAETARPDWLILDHYTGADDSNHLDRWALRVLATLHPSISHLVDGIPESPKDRKEVLSTWIAMACRRHEQNHGKEAGTTRLLLILDALDQNSDGGKDLDLLKPEVLGPDAIVVTSAADNTPARGAAKDYETVTVPPLTAALKGKMIAETLKRYRKKLSPDLAQRLANAEQAGSPLFLTLALEELRLDARHESLGDLITDILKARDAQQLFLNNFLLDEDYGRPELPTLAAAFMALLGASHAGLTENELADLLALPGDPKAKDTKKPRLPQIHLSRLLANLGPFLLNKEGRRAPMHRIFGEAALNHYGTVPVREHLYRHFEKGYGRKKNDFDARAATEALHQITQLAKTAHDNETNARKRLVKDLGKLWVPVNLHDANENATKVVLDALTELNDKEKSALAGRWKKEISSFDAESAGNNGESIGGFANWLREIAFDRYRLSRILLNALLHRQEKTLGTDDLRLSETLNRLGMTCQVMADFVPVRQLFERALAVTEIAQGSVHPYVAGSLNNLAVYLDSTGDAEDFAAARALYERALGIYETALGPDHPDVASCLSNLAVYLNSTGDAADFTAARATFERALLIRETALSPDHPDVALSLNNLAGHLDSTGDAEDFAAARALYERALGIYETALGSDHPDVAQSLNNLAVYLDSTGDATDFAAARRLFERALVIREAALGPDHPDVALSLNNLAGHLDSTGDAEDFAAARALYERALGIYEQRFGPEHEETLRVMQNLAVSLRNTGRLVEAGSLQREVMARFIRVYGEDGLQTASSYSAMGALMKLKGEFAEAETYYRKALAIRERELGQDDEATLLVRQRLGELNIKGESA